MRNRAEERKKKKEIGLPLIRYNKDVFLDAIGCSHCRDQKDRVETFDRVSVNIRDTMSTREVERLFLSLSLFLSRLDVTGD